MTMIQLFNELKLNERIDRLPNYIRRFTIVSMITANYTEEFDDILFGHTEDISDGQILNDCIARIESVLEEKI